MDYSSKYLQINVYNDNINVQIRLICVLLSNLFTVVDLPLLTKY